MTSSKLTKRSNRLLLASLSIGLTAMLSSCVTPQAPTVTAEEENGSDSTEAVVEPEEDTDSSGVELEQRLDERAEYKEVQLTDDDDALSQITDPDESVRALFGENTLEEGQEPSVIEREDFAGYTAITVTDVNVPDDSVRSIRHRVEYEQDVDQLWQVVWVGRQQQCRRGGNPDEWTMQLCP